MKIARQTRTKFSLRRPYGIWNSWQLGVDRTFNIQTVSKHSERAPWSPPTGYKYPRSVESGQDIRI